MSGRLAQKVFESSHVRSVARVVTIGTDALEGINDINEFAQGWVGETAEGVRDALAASGRSGDEEATPLAPAPRASDLVRLARAHDGFHDPEAVDVVYLRPPSITRPRARTTG